MKWLGGFNDEQRKLLADLLNTLAKLLIAGGLVGPWLQQVEITLIAASSAAVAGVVTHLAALYILSGARKTNADD